MGHSLYRSTECRRSKLKQISLLNKEREREGGREGKRTRERERERGRESKGEGGREGKRKREIGGGGGGGYLPIGSGLKKERRNKG